MDTQQPVTNWKPSQKILFRFFFLFLSLLSLIAYNPLIHVLDISYTWNRKFFGNLQGPVIWLDGHIFHTGYLPGEHSIDFSDTHFGVVLIFAFLIITVIATAAWTASEKTRTNYNCLYYWFCNYLAYYVFLAMFTYAIEKVIPIQARYPNAQELLTRWGDLHNWEVLFQFMGTSPAYCMFCGWLELIASVLILFNRTRVVGGLLMAIVLIQVVLFNIFYNNNIIVLSGILLLCTLFMIARAMPKLYTIFIRLKPVSLAEYRYTFHTPWKKYAMILLCFLPVWRIYSETGKSWKYYQRYTRNQEKQRLYNVVVYQQENDTIAPVITDTTRWKYVCFLDFSPASQQLVKFDMQEKKITYQCKWDTLHNTLTIADRNDTINKNLFSYTRFANGNMELKGKWRGKSTIMQLANMPIDSMVLVKDKFLFMQEDQ